MTTVKLYRKGGKKDFRIEKRNGMFFVFEGAKCLREYITSVEEAEHQINLIVLNRKKANMESVPILNADGSTSVKPLKFVAKNPVEKTCSICDKPFLDDTYALQKKYCSDDCKKEGYAKSNKEAQKKYQQKLRERRKFDEMIKKLFLLENGVLLSKTKRLKLEFFRNAFDHELYTAQLWKQTKISKEGGLTRRTFAKKGNELSFTKTEFSDYVLKCGFYPSNEALEYERKYQESKEQFPEQPREEFKEVMLDAGTRPLNIPPAESLPNDVMLNDAIVELYNLGRKGELNEDNFMEHIRTLILSKYDDNFIKSEQVQQMLQRLERIIKNSIPIWRERLEKELKMDSDLEHISDDPFNKEEPIIREYMKEELPINSKSQITNEVEMYVDIVIDALKNLFLNSNASIKAEMPQYVMRIASLLPISYSKVIEMGHRCQKGIAQTLEVKKIIVSTMMGQNIVPTDYHFEEAKALYKSVSGISPLGTTDALAIYTNDVLKAFATVSENQLDLAKRLTDLDNSNSDKIGRLVDLVSDTEKLMSKSIEQSSNLIALVNESFSREKQLYDIIENMRSMITDLQTKVEESKKKKGWFNKF